MPHNREDIEFQFVFDEPEMAWTGLVDDQVPAPGGLWRTRLPGGIALSGDIAGSTILSGVEFDTGDAVATGRASKALRHLFGEEASKKLLTSETKEPFAGPLLSRAQSDVAALREHSILSMEAASLARSGDSVRALRLAIEANIRALDVSESLGLRRTVLAQLEVDIPDAGGVGVLSDELGGRVRRYAELREMFGLVDEPNGNQPGLIRDGLKRFGQLLKGLVPPPQPIVQLASAGPKFLSAETRQEWDSAHASSPEAEVVIEWSATGRVLRVQVGATDEVALLRLRAYGERTSGEADPETIRFVWTSPAPSSIEFPVPTVPGRVVVDLVSEAGGNVREHFDRALSAGLCAAARDIRGSREVRQSWIECGTAWEYAGDGDRAGMAYLLARSSSGEGTAEVAGVSVPSADDSLGRYALAMLDPRTRTAIEARYGSP